MSELREILEEMLRYYVDSRGLTVHSYKIGLEDKVISTACEDIMELLG